MKGESQKEQYFEWLVKLCRIRAYEHCHIIDCCCVGPKYNSINNEKCTKVVLIHRLVWMDPGMFHCMTYCGHIACALTHVLLLFVIL